VLIVCLLPQLSTTCVALQEDEAKFYTGSKDCSVLQWDVETGTKTTFMGRDGKPYGEKREGNGGSRPKSRNAEVLAVAVSSDGRYLASGGRDKLVRVWDTRSQRLVESFSGHRDLVSCLVFRLNSHMLFSGSFDRSIKHWNLDEMGYIETLYGHTSEVTGIDMRTAERAVTCGRDRSLRLWKIPEESQLVYNGKGVMDCVAMVTGEDSVSGSDDGMISMWHVSKKKAVFEVPKAHGGSGACEDPLAFPFFLRVLLTSCSFASPVDQFALLLALLRPRAIRIERRCGAIVAS
jgi:ribosomal RNA-processing protein 9